MESGVEEHDFLFKKEFLQCFKYNMLITARFLCTLQSFCM